MGGEQRGHMTWLSMETRDETIALVQAVDGGGQSGGDVEKGSVCRYAFEGKPIRFADGPDTGVSQKACSQG